MISFASGARCRAEMKNTKNAPTLVFKGENTALAVGSKVEVHLAP